MHLLVTDRLTCPRCGPEFGLILLAHQTGGERRVLEGELGCANCRDRFPVRDGFGDLRAPPRGELPESRMSGEADPEEAERLQALLGLVEGPGLVALMGGPARHAPELADLIQDIEVLAVDSGSRGWTERRGVTRLVAGPGLPVFSRGLRGAVVDGGLGRRWIGEAVRALAPKGRIVVVAADPDEASRLRDAGLQLLAHEDETIVAARL